MAKTAMKTAIPSTICKKETGNYQTINKKCILAQILLGLWPKQPLE
jgi:hypothetical protein